MGNFAVARNYYQFIFLWLLIPSLLASHNNKGSEQPRKKDAVTVLKQAWVEAGKPCSFDDVLSMFLPYRAEIEDDNGYSIAALIMGIRANIGAGNLRAA